MLRILCIGKKALLIFQNRLLTLRSLLIVLIRAHYLEDVVVVKIPLLPFLTNTYFSFYGQV